MSDLRKGALSWLVVLVVFGTGCASARSSARPMEANAPSEPTVPAPTHVVVSPLEIPGYTTDELLAELEGARSLLLVEKFQEAAEALDRIEKLAVAPSIRAAAAYHSGLAFEGLGDRARALERYRLVVDSFGDQGVARNALIRVTRILGRLERWGELAEAADRLLGRGDLLVIDQLEARGAKALALVEQRDLDGATVQIGKALELIERHGFGRSGQPPVQVAQVSFARGEILRIKSEALALLPVTAQFGERLEARCQALLDAQEAYTDAMRARDSFWSAMSGFRVGQLYTQLHSEALAMKPPAKAKTLKQKQLFEGALRLRYRVLLEKGLRMMDATVRLGDRTGEDTEWVLRAREAKVALERSLEEEKAALGKLPYTEEELRKGLELLKGRPADAAAAPSGGTSAPSIGPTTEPTSPPPTPR